MISRILLPLLLLSLTVSASSPLPPHPRLLLTDARAAELRKRLDQDPRMRAWFERVRERAEGMASEPPLKRDMEGYRLLHVSREVLARILHWGVVHRLDPDPKWVGRARRELLAVCAFDNWNPDHFLDVAEMAAAVALGYDWFYHDLSPEERETIEQGLRRHALEPGMEGGWWVRAEHNWNPVR